jgi:hypothetical protein
VAKASRRAESLTTFGATASAGKFESVCEAISPEKRDGKGKQPSLAASATESVIL